MVKNCNLLIPAWLRCIEQRQKERNKNVNSISSQNKRPPIIFISYYVLYFMSSKSHYSLFIVCAWSMHVYVLMDTHGGGVLHMLACRWQRSTFDVFFCWSPHFFFKIGSLTEPGLIDWVGWLVNKPREPTPCLLPTSTGAVPAHATRLSLCMSVEDLNSLVFMLVCVISPIPHTILV